MEPNGNIGRRGLPKLRELFRRQRRDSETISESPDLEFVYDDADTYSCEIAELYSYTEEPEFFLNRECFQDLYTRFETESWTHVDETVHNSHILRLLNEIEVSDRQCRLKSIRSVLYLIQGCFEDCDTEDEQQSWTRYNVLLLYKCGILNSFVELLSMEMDNGVAASSALRKPAISLADSLDLRLIMNVIYLMIETMRCIPDNDREDVIESRNNFIVELGQPCIGDEPLAVVVLGMVTKFCSGSAPHFPMKKVLLLLWKTILVSLGGLNELHDQKNKVREKNGLPILTENTLEVCKHMRAASPPASAADFLEQQQPKKRNIRDVKKQKSMDDASSDMDNDGNEKLDDINGGYAESRADSPRPGTPVTETIEPRRLPWTPKVRSKDLESFLDHTRSKFVGFTVNTDTESLAGLPHPIHEGVKVLKQHLYISLGEVQMKREDEIARNPLSKPEDNVVQTSSEILYQAMLPNLPQYMIALLKILLAAAPTSKAKTDSINILADVLPEEMPTTVLQSMKLGIDVNRHKEIIVKSCSAILLLLLKHFKLNHIFQFEFMSQHLVFANCIPLVLKFFNQNISSYITAKNSIPVIDFPLCVIGEHPELTADNLEAGDKQEYCWRNLFSCINLLRILNKLTKWKHSRTMMLVVFKSAPILKRALRVKQAMLQLYVLKLLKMQTKYLGRQWRKSNMKTLSAIYQKVRHRLNDDWAFGNDMDARPWDFQTEECALRACVDRFNNRRYANSGCADTNFLPVDNCITSVLGCEIDLPNNFKDNVEEWVEQEVFSTQIDWDQVLRK